jgi:hypothetical protein
LKSLQPIYRIPIIYGLIAAAASISLFCILYYAGRNPLLIPAFLDFRILLFPIFLVFGIRDYKENHNQGILHFWQGISIGMQTILIIAFLMSLFILIFGTLIEPGFVHEFVTESIQNIELMRDKLLESIGKESLEKSLELLPTTTIVDLAIDYLIKSLPYGIFLAIIISLILRKKPNF